MAVPTEHPTVVSPAPTWTLPPLALQATPVTLRELHPEAITDTLDTGLGKFVFGETRVIETNRTIVYLGGWLPDNERLLVSWYITPVVKYNEYEGIGTYNVNTGEFQEYGQRRYQDQGNLVWLPAT